MSYTEDTRTIQTSWMLQFFVSPKLRLYRHLFVIALISIAKFNSEPKFVEPALSISRVATVILFLLLFYVNMYLFVPRFLFKGKYLAYILSVLFLIAVASLIYIVGWDLFDPYVRADSAKEMFNLLPHSFVIVVLTSSSSAVKIFQRSIIDSQKINTLENHTLKAEMEQLKNQINPHFLFNMLNNANVLTQKNPAKASKVLMKLSDLLRYQLYDGARASVLLTADIHFLEDFLNLENVRRDNFEYMVSKDGELSGVQIAPLLLITFVENAVKHNMDNEKPSYVRLFFNVQRNVLHFKCINSKPRIPATRNGSGGLGLANVKRRLELIYPARHTMNTQDHVDTYTVTLTISL